MSSPALPFPTLVAALAHRAATTPHALGYTFLPDGEGEGGTRTWGALDARARAVAAALRATGSPGDRVLLAFDEGLPFLDALFGCFAARRVAVPVHAPDPRRWARTAPRLAAVAHDADVCRVLTSADLVDAVSNALPGVPVDAVGAEPDPGAPADPVAPGDLAYLQYTSGSTAEPRGVRVTHRHLAHQLTDFDHGYHHQPDGVLVSWLPATHDLGLVYGRLMALWAGMSCVFFPPAAFVQRPARWARVLSRYRGTHSASPDFGFALAARRPTDAELEGIDLSAVRVLVDGAEPIRPESEEAFVRRYAPYGLPAAAITHALGMSETTAKIATEPPGRTPPAFLWLEPRAYEENRVVPVPRGTPNARPVASNGFPQFDTRVFAVDPATSEKLAEDRVGELWVSGTTVADGYWNRPAATAETFGARTSDGDGPFLRTGDLGFLHGGEVYLSGRRKDVLVLRGQNHHPADLERSLQQAHPDLRPGGVVVFGGDGPEGEALCAVCEVSPETAPGPVFSALREALSEQGLAAATLALVPPKALPKTSSGKWQRVEARRRLASGELPVLHRVDAGDGGAPAPVPALREEILRTPARRRVAVLERHLVGLVAARLGVDAADVDLDRPFKELGLDSVRAVELVEDAGRALGVELRGTALFDHPTVAAMAEHLSSLL